MPAISVATAVQEQLSAYKYKRLAVELFKNALRLHANLPGWLWSATFNTKRRWPAPYQGSAEESWGTGVAHAMSLWIPIIGVLRPVTTDAVDYGPPDADEAHGGYAQT